MRYIAFYLLIIALIAIAISATTGALAADIGDGCIGAGTITHPCSLQH